MSRFTRIVATAVATLAVAPAASAAAACDNTNLVPTKANAPKVRAAVMCLTNQSRAAKNLRPLK